MLKTLMNHNRSTALEWSVIDYLGGGGGLKLVLLDQRALSIKPFSDGKPVWGTHADPFHMPLSAASDQGLYRLLIGISM